MADKRYDQFTQATPDDSRIILHADATTGALNKCALSDLPNTPAYFQPWMLAMQAFGTRVLNYPVSHVLPYYTSYTVMQNTFARISAIYLPAGIVTGVFYRLQIQGVYTANNYNGMALYSISGNNLINIASTTNNGNFWKATAGIINVIPFSSSITIIAGWYFIGTLWNASAITTAPGINSISVNDPVRLLSTGAQYLNIYVSGITTLQTNFNSASLSGSANYIETIGCYR